MDTAIGTCLISAVCQRKKKIAKFLRIKKKKKSPKQLNKIFFPYIYCPFISTQEQNVSAVRMFTIRSGTWGIVCIGESFFFFFPKMVPHTILDFLYASCKGVQVIIHYNFPLPHSNLKYCGPSITNFMWQQLYQQSLLTVSPTKVLVLLAV